MRLTHMAAAMVIGAAGTLAACGAGGASQATGNAEVKAQEEQMQPAPEGDTPKRQAQSPKARSETPKDGAEGASSNELESFLPEGATMLSSANGDLNRDGRMDAVLVADPARTGKEFAGEGPSRVVLLLIRDESGQLRKAKQNGALIPCEKCGGMAGDPFGYVQAKDGVLTTVVEGGSPSVHWSEVCEFDYRPDLQDWILRQVELSASDKIDDKSKQETLTSADLGEVRFEDFDRAKLPHPTTLLQR